MGNYTEDSFPTNRWTDSDTGNELDSCIASIDAAIRHVLGVSTNTLVAPFDITDAGAVTVTTSLAIGTSADMDDIVSEIPATPGSSEDTELATVQAIRAFVLAGDGSFAASSVSVDTSNFGGIFADDDGHDTVQECLDVVDDHTHTESDITDLGSYLPLGAGNSYPVTGLLHFDAAGSSGLAIYTAPSSSDQICYFAASETLWLTDFKLLNDKALQGGNAAQNATYDLVTVDSNDVAIFGSIDTNSQLLGREVILGAQNAAPLDADLSNGSVSFYLDESGNNLMVKAKYSGGTVKTGTVCAVA